jgi:hypothetical protein
MDMVMEINQIAEYILQKLGDKLYDREHLYYIITKTGEIYQLGEYEDLIEGGSNISPAYIFVANLWFTYEPVLYYPFIGERGLLISIYLLKHYCRTHFADLKYIAISIHFTSTNETFMEVADSEVIERNTNLTKLVQMLNEVEDDDEDEKLEEKVDEFEQWFETQTLFNGYNFRKAGEIIERYYKENDKALADDVEAIKYAYYNRVFQPYRVVLSPGKG